MKYAYSPATRELIQTEAIADWMGVTEKVPPEHDPAVESCFWRGDDWEIVGALPPVPPVPESVTMRQARLALLGAGLLDTINAAIAAMPGAAGEAARIEWEFATTIERSNPLFAQLAEQIDLSSEQVDALFVEAAGL
jgi:hypothetical protein